MASSRPSEYRRAARLALQMAPEPSLMFDADDNGVVTVTYTDDPSAGPAAPDNPYATIIARLDEQGTTLFPINTNPERADYQKPKYGSLVAISITRRVGSTFVPPSDEDEFTQIMEELPEGFARDFRSGLGFLWDYRSIAKGIASMPGVYHLAIHGQSGTNDAVVTGSTYLLGQARLADLVSSLKQTTTRYQRQSLKDRNMQVHNTLLHAALPELYREVVPLPSDQLGRLAMRGPRAPSLTKRDRSVALELVRRSAAPLAKEEPVALFRLKNEIELVALEELIARFEQLLAKEAKEAAWQRFFHSNPFILSLAFAVPAIVIAEAAYVGGKSIYRDGGKEADFLARTAATSSLAVIEIKTPCTALLEKRSYRGGIYAPHHDLSGAIAQTLDQCAQLQTHWVSLKATGDLTEGHGYSVRGIVILGMAPTEPDRRKSFDLLRNSLSGVAIVTFDELLGRLKEIHGVLKPAPPPPSLTDDEVPF